MSPENKLRSEYNNCHLFFTRRQGFTYELKSDNLKLSDQLACEDPQKVSWEL